MADSSPFSASPLSKASVLQSREQFKALLEQRIKEFEQGRHSDDDPDIAIVFFDIDRFSTVHAALGYDSGYTILEQIAQRLLESLPQADCVAHMSNDQFAVLLRSESPAQLRVQTHRVLKALRQTITLEERELILTASAGIGLYPSLADSAEELLRQAGVACAQAKRMGGNTCTFYNAASREEPLKRMTLELELRKALDAGEIAVVYQPTFSLAANRITGCEALARWQHPEMGLVLPSEFIPIAEECGMIAEIGEMVLDTVCAQTRAWVTAEKGNEPRLQHVAVNLAAQQIEHRNLVKNTNRILRAHDFPAHSLVLEITESVFIEEHNMIVASLTALRHMGVRIAIDDFGTGYSSLQVLKQFPADLLKIDKLFVTDVTSSHVDATITRAVIDIANSLKMSVIAEGVENDEQVEFLRKAGCDSIQGYYVSAALSAEEFEAELQK